MSLPPTSRSPETSPRTTFLTLPRELRRKIIYEAYYAFPAAIGIRPASRPEKLVVWARESILRLEPTSIQARHIISGFCFNLLNPANVLTANLKEVSEEMAEDVDYVVGKLAWIADLKELIEELKD